MGGGVLIAARSNTFKKCDRVKVSGIDHLEIIIIRLELITTRLFIICLYIPSGSDDIVYDSYSSGLQLIFDTLEITIEDTLLVVGDFNIPKVVWKTTAYTRRTC